jgi:hypothetical protein
MKTWKIVTITTVTVVVAAVLLISSVSAMMAPWAHNPFSSLGRMMGDYGSSYPQQDNLTAPFHSFGGCHNRGYGSGTVPYTNSGTPINITTATNIAKNYILSTSDPDLTVKHVEEYQSNFYVEVSEKSTGNGAFELIVDKYTGAVYPEMGPNMMWNTKYGMMRGGGMMGGLFGTPTGPLTVTTAQATTNAQQYLNTYLQVTSTGDVTTFYGYYTIEILNGTTPYGMISVNGYTGQVWPHTWHGAFIQEADVS